MSFMGLFPSDRERRLARDEADAALDNHGDQAEMILLMKARLFLGAEAAPPAPFP